MGDFELEHGGLDGVYTTIEGLLQKMHNRLIDANPFGTGDSSTKHHLGTITESNNNDDNNKNGQLPFSQPSQTIQNYHNFLSKLNKMSKGEILRLNDMKTENYHNDNNNEQNDEDDKNEYYGTDQMELLPGSTHFAVPSIAQRGKQIDQTTK